MKREAFKMFLKPGFEKEYEKRHAAIWPELKKMLSDGGVYDYSIYWDKDTNILFACQKTKGEESSQDMGDLGQRNSNRRVIRIHFHDIRHIVPPFLHDRIGSHILRRLLSFSFLTCSHLAGIKKNVVRWRSI